MVCLKKEQVFGRPADNINRRHTELKLLTGDQKMKQTFKDVTSDENYYRAPRSQEETKEQELRLYIAPAKK